jgi:hypothetical protein
MKIKQTDLITVPRSRKKGHCKFLSRSDARVILRQDKAAQIRGLGEGGHSRADAGESPTAPALLLRPIRGKSRRARHKQRHIAAKLPTLGGIPRLAKAYANLWQKVCACSWRRTFDQGYRVLASRVATNLDIRDHVSTTPGCLSQFPNRQIEYCTGHPTLCARQTAAKRQAFKSRGIQ